MAPAAVRGRYGRLAFGRRARPRAGRRTPAPPGDVNVSVRLMKSHWASPEPAALGLLRPCPLAPGKRRDSG
ncbi:hypothetical protein EYF80_063527 [Liparis tanakae]|uniref:Uncharacterized protein n=1 Tax=Liparis tanakae TaxID=230148 RepID=A0A4Z2EC50_9TELE|nr:hypothetical protein EYF80_063527 [Liparis tanakae]